MPLVLAYDIINDDNTIKASMLVLVIMQEVEWVTTDIIMHMVIKENIFFLLSF